MFDNCDKKGVEGLITRLQENTKDIWRPCFSDCTYMIKWLKARDYDLKKAETMLRNHIVWRETENVDSILDDFRIPDVYEMFGFGGYCGNDKEGHPVWYDCFGRVDPQGILKSISTVELMRIRIFFTENVMQNIFPLRSNEEGRPIRQIIALFDMDGFSRKHLWRPGMECIIENLKVVEANYPEYINKLLIFNTPPIFKIAYNIIKPFLHHATRNKITFLGKHFKTELLKLIDADQLPAYYGGTMYGPNHDPMCRHLIRWGGEIPSSYYFNKHKQEMISIVVSPRSKIKLSYRVNQADSVIYYEFSTKDHDVNFGIYYIGEEFTGEIESVKSSQLEKIVTLQRSHSNIMIQKEEIGNLRVGFYLIEFDNSYSWTRSKYIQYHIEILDVMK